ncbi:hypothetical protein SISNIDRAFT_490322 [Sistotremastrum niveocremeum HHB9708]|uniref:F-box domain-containing protein n=1 Tax=Sistotremastrum niveocremeum HHB9708 TaxID=1314777 RepID=A0A164P375_9AGAM|nr:hypothetical protein SISNIDRAFT_490322 [Sistotremastrum niveocremeum HHB9708]
MAEPFHAAHDLTGPQMLEQLECPPTCSPTLPILPAELILLIFEEACSDRNTAISICRTSRHYRHIFEVYYLRSVRFRSPSDLRGFAESSSTKALVRDMEFVFSGGMWSDETTPGKIFRNFSAETFQGCSGIRALSFQTSDNKMTLGHPFLSLINILQPTHILFSASIEWAQHIVHFSPGSGRSSFDALRSVTHLAISWYYGGFDWEKTIMCFGSLTHLWIRLDMRIWSATHGRFLHDGMPSLAAKGIRVLLTVHDSLPFTERMVLGIIRQYVNPGGVLRNLRIRVEPPDGLDFEKFNWATVLMAQFAEVES